MPGVDFNFWLGRKYALMGAQQDTADKNAETSRIGTVAAANLDNTKNKLLPLESAASIRKSDAETGLVGQQSKWFGPVAQAGIGLTNAQVGLARAQTAYTGTQDKAEQRWSLFDRDPGTPYAAPSMFQLSTPLPARRPSGY